MASAIYNSAKLKLLSGNINLGTDTINVALCTSSYTPNIDTQTYYSDITNELPTAGGYTVGGATLTGETVTQDNTNNRAIFAGNNVSWTNATFTARYAVLYKNTGTGTTSPLIAYIDFGIDKTFAAETATIQWNVIGILTLT
jgi:hypothetical protein